LLWRACCCLRNVSCPGTAVGGEKSEFYPQLLKIYRKKIKRAKKKTDEAEEEEEDDDLDLGDLDEEEGEGEEDDDSCPVNCDNVVYEKVLELRDKRLDQEDILADINKGVDELKKLNERLALREKNIDKELKATDADIVKFQSEKQQALNQIVVAVPIKMKQIKYLDEGKLPADISQALVFTHTSLQKLHDTIQGIEEEKVSRKKEIADLKAQHKQLTKIIKQKRTDIDAARTECEKVQMMKLGKVINPELLEQISSSAGTSEMQDKVHAYELFSDQEIVSWDKRIQDAKDQYTLITRENTERLQQVGELTKKQYTLESELNASTQNVSVADTGPLEARAADERNQLIELVKRQANDVEALKAEIHILRRKGGHVYSPVTRLPAALPPPPKPQPLPERAGRGPLGIPPPHAPSRAASTDPRLPPHMGVTGAAHVPPQQPPQAVAQQLQMTSAPPPSQLKMPSRPSSARQQPPQPQSSSASIDVPVTIASPGT
jgi:hypothetical protein